MMKFHFLFEQSGVFKNAARALGYTAYDYDIVKTENVDFQLDLLWNIENCGTSRCTIFDGLGKDDVVFAFFPCTYFSTMSFLPLRLSWRNYGALSVHERFKAIQVRAAIRQNYFGAFLKLFDIAECKGFQLVVENPWTASYLRQNAPFTPQIIHNDRTKYGDVLKKPTAYWCLNWCPTSVDMPLCCKERKGDVIHLSPGIARSLIHYDYALNFLTHYFGSAESHQGV